MQNLSWGILLPVHAPSTGLGNAGLGVLGATQGTYVPLGLWSGGLPPLVDVHIHHDQRAAGALTASNIRFFFFAICDRLQLKTAGLVRVCKRAMRECMCVLCACVRACVRMYCYVWFTRAM